MGASKNCLFPRRLRWRCTQILMYSLYTVAFRAVPPCQYEKILIFRDALIFKTPSYSVDRLESPLLLAIFSYSQR